MINVPPERSGPSNILDSKYSLVIAVAKRARQIVNRREPGIVLPHKPVIMALDEIAQGRIRMVNRDEATPDVPEPEGASEVPETPGPEFEKPQ